MAPIIGRRMVVMWRGRLLMGYSPVNEILVTGIMNRVCSTKNLDLVLKIGVRINWAKERSVILSQSHISVKVR